MQVQQALVVSWSDIMYVCMYIHVSAYVHMLYTYVCVPVTGLWLKYANFTLVCVSHCHVYTLQSRQ